MFGIEAAAQRYFHKPAPRLFMDEGTRLATVIPSLRHQATETTSSVEKKKDLILRLMATP